MRRVHLLESKNYVAGGNVQVSLRDLPPNFRVQAICLRLEAVFTTGAAQAAIPSGQLFRIFQNIEIGRLTKVTGLMMHYMNWLQRGGEHYLPGGIPATNASTFRRNIEVVIPWFDPHIWAPGDICPQTEEFQNLAMSIDFGSLTGLDNATNTWNTLSSIAGTLRAYAILDESNDIVSPKCHFGYVDWNGQSIVADPGLYEYGFIYNEDGTVFDNAAVVTAALAADGRKVADPIKYEEWTALYNFLNTQAAVIRAASATAPIAGSEFTHEPAYTAGAAATVTPEFLPLVFKAPFGKLSQALPVENNLRIDLTGTKNSFRFAYKRLEAHDESSVLASFRKQAVPVTSVAQVDAKTESKAPLSAGRAWLGRFLPLRAKVSK